MSPVLDAPSFGPYLADVRDDAAALRKVLAAIPTSIRRLADEAGVDDRLLRMIRDGDRALTPDVREALRGVLRRWEDDCREAADLLERTAAAEPESEGG